MSLVAGVDSSTQSCKIVIRELETGAPVRCGRATHPDGSEVEPDAWWTALRLAIADAGGLQGVSAVSVAAQQHGMVVLDGDGRVIRPALLWNDTRSAEPAAALVREFGAAELARRTGSVPVASFTLSKLRWLLENEPENAARVAAVALPHDWLSWRLRGYGPAGESPRGPDLAALMTDRSDASGTAYYSPREDAYDRELLAAGLGRGDVLLPRVLGPAERAGVSVALSGVIPEGVVLGAGCGDNAGAALGLQAGVGDVIVSVGTSGTVFAVSELPTADPDGTVAGFADAAGAFLPLIATLNAARVLSTVAGMLSVSLERFSELALSAPAGADGVVLIPYFDGERTPNLPHARASLHGLSGSSSRAENVARAAVEGMLCGLGAGLDGLRALGVHAARLLLIGGGAQSPAVRQIAAQVFDLPVLIPTAAEYVADGAAAQAAWALTGSRPDWPLALDATPAADHRPLIRRQYAEVAAQALSGS